MIAANRTQHAAVPINHQEQRDVLDASLLVLTKLLAANAAALKAIRDSRSNSIDDVRASRRLMQACLQCLGTRRSASPEIGPSGPTSAKSHPPTSLLN